MGTALPVTKLAAPRQVGAGVMRLVVQRTASRPTQARQRGPHLGDAEDEEPSHKVRPHVLQVRVRRVCPTAEVERVGLEQH